jgi:hypothetical protein
MLEHSDKNDASPFNKTTEGVEVTGTNSLRVIEELALCTCKLLC